LRGEKKAREKNRDKAKGRGRDLLQIRLLIWGLYTKLKKPSPVYGGHIKRNLSSLRYANISGLPHTKLGLERVKPIVGGVTRNEEEREG